MILVRVFARLLLLDIHGSHGSWYSLLFQRFCFLLPAAFTPGSRRWRLLVVDLLFPQDVSDQTQLMTHGDEPSIPVVFAAPGVTLEDILHSRTLSDRAVRCLNPRPFQRAPAHLAHVSPDRVPFLLIAAVVADRRQQAVAGQFPAAGKSLDRAHLRQDRITQDGRDTRQRRQATRGRVLSS